MGDLPVIAVSAKYRMKNPGFHRSERGIGLAASLNTDVLNVPDLLKHTDIPGVPDILGHSEVSGFSGCSETHRSSE